VERGDSQLFRRPGLFMGVHFTNVIFIFSFLFLFHYLPTQLHKQLLCQNINPYLLSD